MHPKKLCLLLLVTLPFIGTAFSEDDKNKHQKKMDLSLLPPAATRQGITYEADIKPLLKNACFRCHGEEKQKGDLRLDSLKAILEGGEDGKIVLPGNSAHSQLVISVARINRESAMPPIRKLGKAQEKALAGSPVPTPGPTQKSLTAAEVGLVRAWIDQGAK